MSHSMRGLLLAMVFAIAPLFAQSTADIPFHKYVLSNGLTVIIHEDHKAPIAAVDIWYHVGSKNEKAGKTGFAHLFEHLMFNGSEHMNDDYFQVMERIGATGLNGTTNNDRTNFFENVPVSALDIALWMESDRMGHLLPAIDQGKLDEQRGVVQNEKRQGENQPYSVSRELLTKASFPSEHPYSWTVIGSMDDLNAASLEDVQNWFKSYYGAANAVITVAGDVNTDDALARVKKYFGDIPAGPPVQRQSVWIAKRSGTHKQTVQDRVPQARVYMSWNIPQWGSTEGNYLDLVSDVLSVGKTSRLYKRLVYDEQIATDVSAYIDLREIAGLFQIEATAKPGVPLEKIEKIIDEELQKFIKNGPTKDELARYKTGYKARFIRGMERIGGFGGKADILSKSMVFGGRPDYYKKNLADVQNATPAGLRQAAQKWLSDGKYILEVTPFPKFSVAKKGADRSKLPQAGTPPDAKFPKLEKATLSNGLKIVLAHRDAVPVVNFNLLLDAGFAADQFATPGTANMAMSMLDEGTDKRSALEISEQLAALGANLHAGSNLDNSNVSLSALKANLDKSLEIYSDVILHPSFPQADFDRLKKQTLSRIRREKVTPIQMALRVFPQFLYGKNHAYGNPFTGSGTMASVKAMTRNDLIKFHDTWFKPNNATLVIVGAIRMDEIKPKLEDLFEDWDKGSVPHKNIARVDYRNKKKIFLMDRPGALQSIIFAGHIAPPKNNPQEQAIQMMNKILGGEFTSRINMNLREDKHWAYGAFTILIDAEGQRPYIVYAPVQTDKTVESMLEIDKELKGYIGKNPPKKSEFAKTRKNAILQLPGRWETNAAIMGSISQMVRFGLPDDYYQKYPANIRNLKLNQIRKAAKTVVKPDDLVWIVVGDRAKIEAGIKKAHLGSIELIDADGKPLQ